MNDWKFANVVNVITIWKEDLFFIIIGWILAALLNIFLLGNLFIKYCNDSNIKAFKDTIEIPYDLLEIKRQSVKLLLLF
jgi:hypothetical protein